MAKLQRGMQAGTTPAPAPTPISPVAAPAPVIMSPCIVLRNMYDPYSYVLNNYLECPNMIYRETEPNWEKEIAEDVKDECSKFGSILHVHVEKNSAGEVFLKFGSIPGAQNAINALNRRWFAQRMITAEFIPEGQYYARFPEALSK